MDIKDVKNLDVGDEVYWTDPDEGKCSRYLIISDILVRDDNIIQILAQDGSCLECFPWELS